MPHKTTSDWTPWLSLLMASVQLEGRTVDCQPQVQGSFLDWALYLLVEVLGRQANLWWSPSPTSRPAFCVISWASLLFAQGESIPLQKVSPNGCLGHVAPKLKWCNGFTNSSIQQMTISAQDCQILSYLPGRAAAIIWLGNSFHTCKAYILLGHW